MGTVYWFTGLSGAGKTTIGKLFYERLRQEKNSIVFLDGDILREVFSNDLGHSLKDRKRSATRNSRLCKMLADQGLDVICATISMFHDCRQWNRNNIKNYKEIYIKVPLNVLIERDQKNLYTSTLAGKNSNVMGVDLEIEEPKMPDFVICNEGKRSPEDIVIDLLTQLKI